MTQLHLDTHARSKLNGVWTFGANVGPAPLLLRREVQKQVQVCRDDLGLKQARCSGWLSDEMLTIGPDGSFDFARIEAALDKLVENHIVPYLDLSGMPAALAREGSAVG